MTDKSITDIAAEAAQAYADHLDKITKRLYRKAVDRVGHYEAGMAFVHAFTSLAGVARCNKDDGLCNRLRDAAYRYRPEGVGRREVRDLLVAAHAAGYIAREPDDRPTLSRRSMMSMVFATKDAQV